MDEVNMSDKEKAEEYVKSVIDVNAFDWKIVRELILAYLEGLKAGKDEAIKAVEEIKRKAEFL